MTWFKRNPDQQIKYVYIPLIAGCLAIVIMLSDLAAGRKLALVAMLVLLGAVHWDLRDGGLISRLIYHRGGSFNLRNYLTVGLAFLAVTVILVLTNAFYTPLLMLYYIPIVLGALRGGHRLSLVFVSALAVSLSAYFYLNGRASGNSYSAGSLYLLLFLALSAASGVIADRLRRAAVDLSALYETGRAINSTLNIREIFSLMLNIVFLDLSPDLAAIFLVDEDNKGLTLQAFRGPDFDLDRDMKVVMGHGPIGRVAARSTPICVSQVNRRWQLNFAPRLNSVMAVPMRATDRTIGVLMVGRYAEHAYGFENVRFLEALASQAAISIQNAKLYRQTKEWALLDGLTGIYNYRYFAERLDSEWSRAIRYEKPLSLIMIDVDLFKSVNDTYGHLCGDDVLRELAALLKHHTRETDIVARYGGEEFVIILPETHYNDAYTVAEKLRGAVSEATFSGGRAAPPSITLTISLGIANYPTTAFSKSDLIYQADQALYQAKLQRNSLVSPLDMGRQVNLNPKAT